MKRTTITLPDDLAEFVGAEARRRESSVSEIIRGFIVQGLSGPSEPREIPWAALFNDPDMVPAERLEEALASDWADVIDRDRG